MIVYLSIVDKHLPPGQRHVGVICVDVPGIDGASHYDVQAVAVPPEEAERFSPHVGKLLVGKDQVRALFGPLVNGCGESV